MTTTYDDDDGEFDFAIALRRIVIMAAVVMWLQLATVASVIVIFCVHFATLL